MFDDNPMMLVAIVAVLGVIGALVWKKSQSGESSGSKKKKSGKGKASRRDEVDDDDDDDEEENDDETSSEESSEWGWSAPTANNTVDDTKVSVQEVDPLNEFNIYKQFGYHEKAAESLSVYMKNYPDKVTPKLIAELVGLWLEAKKVDQVAETLTQYQAAFPNEILADYIKKGLALDANHLGLRVLAENRLGWGVKKTAQEIGEKTEAPTAASASDRPKTLGKKKEGAQTAKAIPRKPLVLGESTLGKISQDEKGAVLSFMNPEDSVKLLKGALNYELATKFLNKAIRTSAKPAALLIDALTLDFKAKNVSNFAEHLWHLYHNLGQSGRQVRERMLGLGYTLGEHPVFNSLETAGADASALREIGIQNGYLDLGASQKKARHRDLVSEVVDSNVEAKTPAERALKEAESLLMYGQLDQSLDLLERAIKSYPQESQLYVALFDLYERAEEWERLEKLLQELRSQIQTLPEEVVLAMSQLLQRFNNGSFGN